MKIRITDIKIGERRRGRRSVESLVESIKQIGLLNPITVTEDFRLIAGFNRLEAAKSMGWTEIECNTVSLTGLKADLAEIDENLIRNELTALERGEQLARRKEIYEALHPETKHGGDRGNQHTGGKGRQGDKLAVCQTPEASGGPGNKEDKTADNLATVSFVDDTAKKTGASPRTVRREVKISKDIAPEVKEAIRNTPMADNQSELLELSRMEPEEQKALIDIPEIMEAIKAGEKAVVHNHRAQGTGDNEWYTPKEYIEVARAFLGEIDLDPASSEFAQKTVQAGKFYTINDDGLNQRWIGRVYCNPPYSQPHIKHFSFKLVSDFINGDITEAIMLTHNYTDTEWFHHLAGACTAICFTRGRIAFLDPNGKKAAPTQGQAFFYFGPTSKIQDFKNHFGKYGLILQK